jgi:hypothetical protein
MLSAYDGFVLIPPRLEWVWNEASIDNAKVVWAHDMGESQNQELLQYFAQRQARSIDADGTDPKLTPYSTARAAPQRLP